MANKETCKAADCNREVIAKGYCRKHYRLWKAGEMPKPRYKICTGENCRKPRFGSGSLCEEHYKAARGARAAKSGAAAPATPATPAASA
jgi:hypothetical protein